MTTRTVSFQSEVQTHPSFRPLGQGQAQRQPSTPLPGDGQGLPRHSAPADRGGCPGRTPPQCFLGAPESTQQGRQAQHSGLGLHQVPHLWKGYRGTLLAPHMGPCRPHVLSGLTEVVEMRRKATSVAVFVKVFPEGPSEVGPGGSSRHPPSVWRQHPEDHPRSAAQLAPGTHGKEVPSKRALLPPERSQCPFFLSHPLGVCWTQTGRPFHRGTLPPPTTTTWTRPR